MPQLQPVEVAAPEGIAAGFETAEAGGAEALVVLGDAMFWNHRGRIGVREALTIPALGCT
jgi:hypothetical protein